LFVLSPLRPRQLALAWQVLVHGHDHFCPWTGTVVAGNNIRYFYMFVSGLLGLLMWIFFLVVFGQSTALGGDGGRIRHPMLPPDQPSPGPP